jgi:hypothetical protein
VLNLLSTAIDLSAALIPAPGEAERNLGRLVRLADTLSLRQMLVRPFIKRKVVLSLRIELTRASLMALYQYESVQLSVFHDVSDVCECTTTYSL